MGEERNHFYSLREGRLNALEELFAVIFDDSKLQAISLQEAAILLERLTIHFDKMEEAHFAYRAMTLLASNNVHTEMEQRFVAAKAKLNDKLKEPHCQDSMRFGATEIMANSTMLGPQVFRVETARQPQIGTFNGSPEDWPAFRDLFVAEVHNKDLDDVTKLLYLQKACIENAAQTLGPWRPLATNYKKAWETMNQAYNDEYHVIHGILGKIFNMPSQENESYASLRAILDVLRGGTRQLETMCETDVLQDQIWIHLAKRRLPKSTLDSWEQYRNRHGIERMPTLEEFGRFLDTKSKGRREFETETTSEKQGRQAASERQGNQTTLERQGNQSYNKEQGNIVQTVR